jgi:hypothetical protein
MGRDKFERISFRRAFLVASVPLLAACYTYTETSIETLSPGIQTRVRLDEEGFGRVVNQAASNGVPMENLDFGGRELSGRLLSLEPTNMIVQLRGAGGSVFSADIPMQGVQAVAVRTFSSRRTIFAVAASAAAGSLLWAGTVGGGGDEFPDPDDGSRVSIPIFSLPLR